ncbi:amidohydrolase family protein [Nocardiopsis oceani]
MSLLILGAEVEGRPCDVRVQDGRVAEIASGLRPGKGEEVITARGGALLPGLHDHHIHLLALAAAAGSVDCGPPRVTGREQLREALRSAAAASPADTWLRGTGYHESVAGLLDRDALDAMVPERPVRVQHRGGAVWMLNSRALDELGSELSYSADVERDARGAPTGRLFRYDTRLRAAVGGTSPDLGAVGTRLNGLGITGVTDATPDLGTMGLGLLAAAVADRRLALRVLSLGADVGVRLPPGLVLGPRKLLLRDHDLPGLDELTGEVEAAHRVGRPVAVHCVTRESLLLTLAAIDAVGALRGDRVEHAAVVPPEVGDRIRRIGLRVVTQPSFVTDRGEDYLREVDPYDHDHLYPYATLLASGVRVAPSGDAPFGDPDPWRNMACAASRTTTAGTVVGPHERVPARTVLDGYLSPLETPGSAPRRVAVGAPADLCLLGAPLAEVLAEPTAEHVRAVVSSGVVTRPRERTRPGSDPLPR